MLLPLIPTRIHGVIDYLVGILLFVSPWMFGFSHDRVATLVPVVLGLGTVVYSLLTNYEMGVVHAIPMIGHLWIDLLAGLLLLLSPWLLGFAARVTTGEGDVGRPHVA